MRVTQGCFSFLPDLTDEQIKSQVQYCLDKGWAVNIEFTDAPHPLLGDVGTADVRPARRGRHHERAQRLPARLWRSLHPHLRLRFKSRLGVGEALVHRQPAERG